MQVTFIKPNMGVLNGGRRYVDSGRMEPLQLGVLCFELRDELLPLLLDLLALPNLQLQGYI